MYFDPASYSFEPERATDTRLIARECRKLWKQATAAFPELSGSRFRLEQGGGDHLLLIVDETRAVRFPRPGIHDLGLEIAVLRSLERRTHIAVPCYDVVDPEGCFASYILIAGLPLTATRFSGLLGAVARKVVTDAVTLLTTLHEIDPQAIRPIEGWPRLWSSAQFADRLQKSRLPLLADRMPMLRTPIENFLRGYRSDSSPHEVVLHGDLVGDHLLVDEHTGRLTGIIDFSDIAIGDPAHDFLGFWSYGESAAAYAVSAYDPGGADPTLLARSRNHFIRYRIDRLFETMVDDASADEIRAHSAGLAALLAGSST